MADLAPHGPLNGLHTRRLRREPPTRARATGCRRELFWLRQALVSLQEVNYPLGEDAIDKAERSLALPEHAANDLSTNAGMTVDELREQLDRIMNAKE